jgi:hypothetical protein
MFLYPDQPGEGGGGDYGLVSSDDQDSAAAAAAKRLSLVSRALRIATSALSHVRTRFEIAPLPASQSALLRQLVTTG